MNKKIIIVGGVAGGASTAARLRRLDENATIILLEKGEYISFANCGLPYYIGDVIQDRSQLLVQTVEGMSKKFHLDIRNFSEALSIDRTNKRLTIKNHKTQETYQESYDVLVLSPGAKPIIPPIQGLAEASNVFTLRNIPDMDQIKSFITTNHPKKAVVIGGGFIGLEMLENLQSLGIDTTLVEASRQVMAPLDLELAHLVHEHLIDQGVTLHLNDGVKAIKNNGTIVELSSGLDIPTDLILLSIGVKPESTLAKEAGLTLSKQGAILVNDSLQTSDSSIYALGDAAAVKDFITGEATTIPLAWPANRQGRIVANNLSGKQDIYRGTLGSSVAKVFHYTVATTGKNEKVLQKCKIPYQALHIHPSSHAGYYPGAFPIAYKLLYQPETGKILGAQGVGMDGVEKRIDLIATAIKGGLTVYDLQDIEPCYAPPYNSAKDPVNMLGYYASNLADGIVETIQWYEVDLISPNEGMVLDVREKAELASGTIANSYHIPLGELRTRLDELPKDKTIYVTCQVGIRGYIACRILSANGFHCKNIDGGVKTYLTVQRVEKALQQQQLQTTLPTKEDSIPMDQATINTKEIHQTKSINTCGLQCPGPIKKVYETIETLKEGEILEVSASDPGFTKDIGAWCSKTGNQLIKSEFDKQKNAFVAYIQKGSTAILKNPSCSLSSTEKNNATLIVFSGDLDKAIASFIIATGAASMGKDVTMFFTFWGLNILKKKHKTKVPKDTMEKMFDFMLPNNTDQLGLSKMNMAGMGPAMIKKIMKKHNVDSLDTLLDNAIKMGVHIVACSMSMELMGIKKEEFIDGVEIGGVASYLGAADDAGINLFI